MAEDLKKKNNLSEEELDQATGGIEYYTPLDAEDQYEARTGQPAPADLGKNSNIEVATQKE